jgi:hypothetical protein
LIFGDIINTADTTHSGGNREFMTSPSESSHGELNSPGIYIDNPKTDDIKSPVLRDFFEIWLSLHNGKERPKRRHLSMTRFGNHLPFMVQHGYNEEDRRFQVKYFGSAYADGVGADHTNRYIDEISGSEGLLHRCKQLVEGKVPYLSLNNPVVWSPNTFKQYHVLACPLFNENAAVSSIVFRIEFV